MEQAFAAGVANREGTTLLRKGDNVALKIHELNHVAIHVRDLEASIRFYGEILELPRLPRPAFNFPGAWFALGSQELHLIDDPDLPPNSRRHHHFALRVDDAFAARAALERKGVTGLEGPSPRPD